MVKAVTVEPSSVPNRIVTGWYNINTEAFSITLMGSTTIKVLFGEATAQQRLECHALASGAWGSYLDEGEIKARENHLNAQPLALDGGCRTWCLYFEDNHAQVLSTCKTTHREFFLSNTEGVSTLKGYYITSVVTGLLYRSHGLASYMLQNVAQWLDGPGEAAVSMLYSGIPHFYENLGWSTLPNTEIILSSEPWLQEVLDTCTDLEVRSLNDADFEVLCAQDIELLRAPVQSEEASTQRNRLTVLPTEDLVQYQHALSDFMGNLWHFSAPDKRGAACEDGTWLSWYHDFRGRCLYIQRIHNVIQDDGKRLDVLAALLLSAFREAKEWNFTQVSTWDTSPDVRLALEKLARATFFAKSISECHRPQQISLRWRNSEKRADDIVMENGTYAWNLRS